MTDLIIKTVPHFPGNPGSTTRKIQGKTFAEFVSECLDQGAMGVRYLDRVVSIEVQ